MLFTAERARCGAARHLQQQALANQRGSCAMPCRRSIPSRLLCFSEGSTVALDVRCIKPSSDMHATKQAIKTLGQSFIIHSWHRQLQTRLGREQDVFGGFSRMMLDKFGHEPVLYITDCGKAAANVLSNTQQASLIEDLHAMDFSIIPGSLQMLQSIPESSLPIFRDELERGYQAGLAAVRGIGYSGEYLRVMLLGTQPQAQCKGLGSAVMKAVVFKAQQEQLPLLVHAVDDASVRFYVKFGFHKIGKMELQPLLLCMAGQSATW